MFRAVRRYQKKPRRKPGLIRQAANPSSDVVPSHWDRGRPSLSDGIHTGPRVLAVTISVNRRSRGFCTTTRVYLCASSTPMHKTPKDIARSLRAFRNAHRLGLLRSVRISPGKHACEAAMAQDRMEYLGNAVPRLPLAQCKRALCECDYVPVGTDKLHRNSHK